MIEQIYIIVELGIIIFIIWAMVRLNKSFKAIEKNFDAIEEAIGDMRESLRDCSGEIRRGKDENN